MSSSLPEFSCPKVTTNREQYIKLHGTVIESIIIPPRPVTPPEFGSAWGAIVTVGGERLWVRTPIKVDVDIKKTMMQTGGNYIFCARETADKNGDMKVYFIDDESTIHRLD